MKKQSIFAATIALVLLLVSCGASYEAASATKYYVAHQGGYIGAATVSVDADQNVTAATWSEYQGPSGWAEYNSEDGESLVDGAVVRVPDPTAASGFTYYIYAVNNGYDTWVQYSQGDDGFSRPSRHFQRDFEGMMSNPIRAQAYVEAARNDELYNVTIEGTTVTLGKPASETVHYGHMDKSNPTSTYMGLRSNSIGFRYNVKATTEFFASNPTLDYANARTTTGRLTLVEDRSVDANANVADYTVETDNVWGVGDAFSGATFSDFPHYALELQAAYQMALAKQLADF